MRGWYCKLLLLLGVSLLLAACNVTRKYHEGQYLVQKVEIKPDKEVPRKERISSDEFRSYLKQNATKRFLGTYLGVALYESKFVKEEKDNWWNRTKAKIATTKPMLLDMSLVERSKDNFKNYMDESGFFASQVKYRIDTTRRKHRAKIIFDITQGRPYKITSLRYDFLDYKLAPLVDTTDSKIRIGQTYNLQNLEAERERIANLLRNKGYYDFTVNNIQVEADTLQAPYTIQLVVRINKETVITPDGQEVSKPNIPYRYDYVRVYTQYTSRRADSLSRTLLDTLIYEDMNIIYEGRPNVRKRVLYNLIPIRKDSPYADSEVTNVYNNLMSTGYFRNVRVTFDKEPELARIRGQKIILPDTEYVRPQMTGFLGCNVFCTPTLKQSLSVEAEGSMTSNFWALKASLGYQNRNIFRGVEILDLSGGFGHEWMRAPDAQKRSAVELSLAGKLTIPRILFPGHFNHFKTPRTHISVSVNFQDRPYYRRTLSNASWGYSWTDNGYSTFQLRPADITVIDMSYIDQNFYNSLGNRYLQNSYSSQFVSALNFGYTYNSQKRNLRGNATVIRINAEVAGNLLDGLAHLFGSPVAGKDYYEIFGIRYSQYFRIDASVSRTIKLGEKTAFAGRLIAGTGVAYGNAEALPMDKLFYVGGSNSMRGWAPRTLGPGTSPLPENMLYPTQLGDLRLEGNLEFRFPIWKLFNGATFLDAGNIWFLRRNDAEYSPDAVFGADFYKGLGLNTGLGLRLDIKFAVVRLDLGMQLRNPNNPAGKRWINKFSWSNMSFNFGVGYPF